MLQNFNINVVIICEWEGLGVHFLTANGEDYIYSKNSDTSVILLFEVQQGGGHRHQGRHHSRQYSTYLLQSSNIISYRYPTVLSQNCRN